MIARLPFKNILVGQNKQGVWSLSERLRTLCAGDEIARRAPRKGLLEPVDVLANRLEGAVPVPHLERPCLARQPNTTCQHTSVSASHTQDNASVPISRPVVTMR